MTKKSRRRRTRKQIPSTVVAGIDAPLPYVWRELVRCPHCEGTKHRIYGTVPDQGDGTKLQYAECQWCGKRFKVVFE